MVKHKKDYFSRICPLHRENKFPVLVFWRVIDFSVVAPVHYTAGVLLYGYT
jgi:hypothetical protein